MVRGTVAAGLGLFLLAQASSQPRLIIGVSTLLDGRGAILHDTRIVVEGSRIVAFDPAASPVDIDLGGLTVMPGWIDTHVHLSWYFDEHGRSVRGGDTPQEGAAHDRECGSDPARRVHDGAEPWRADRRRRAGCDRERRGTRSAHSHVAPADRRHAGDVRRVKFVMKRGKPVR